MWTPSSHHADCVIIGLTDQLFCSPKPLLPGKQRVQKKSKPNSFEVRLADTLSQKNRQKTKRKKKLHLYLSNDGAYITRKKAQEYCIPLNQNHENVWYFCWHKTFIRTLEEICLQHHYTPTRLVHWPTELGRMLSTQRTFCHLLVHTQRHSLYLNYQEQQCLDACLIQQQTHNDTQLMIDDYLKPNDTLQLLSSHHTTDAYLKRAGIHHQQILWEPHAWSFIRT